jgi:hypothetical protein
LDTTNLIDRLASSDEPIVNREWADIIPKADIERLNEEKRKKEAAELNLGPRQRVKVNNTLPNYEQAAKKDKKRKRKNKSKSFVDENSSDESTPPPEKKKRGRKKKSEPGVSNGDSTENGASRDKKKKSHKKKKLDGEIENGKSKSKKSKSSKIESEKKKHKGSSSSTKNNKFIKGSSSKKDSSIPNKLVSEKLKQMQSIKFNVEKYKDVFIDKSSSYFKKVVEAFRPASHYLKRLVDKSDSHDVDKALQKIGDFIVDYVWVSDK